MSKRNPTANRNSGLNRAAQQRLKLLEDHYRLGQEALRAPKKMRPVRVNELAAEHGYARVSVHRMRRMAALIDPEAFKRICALRQHNGQPLHWGYLYILVTLEAAGQIEQFAQKAIDNEWNPKQLAAEIRKTLPSNRRRLPRRKPQLRPTLEANLDLLIKEAHGWTNRSRCLVEAQDGQVIGKKLSRRLKPALSKLRAAERVLRTTLISR